MSQIKLLLSKTRKKELAHLEDVQDSFIIKSIYSESPNSFKKSLGMTVYHNI